MKAAEFHSKCRTWEPAPQQRGDSKKSLPSRRSLGFLASWLRRQTSLGFLVTLFCLGLLHYPSVRPTVYIIHALPEEFLVPRDYRCFDSALNHMMSTHPSPPRLGNPARTSAHQGNHGSGVTDRPRANRSGVMWKLPLNQDAASQESACRAAVSATRIMTRASHIPVKLGTLPGNR